MKPFKAWLDGIGMNKRKWQNLVDEKGWWAAYSVYLSSPSWQRKRNRRLKIDKYECRICGSKRGLQVHHKPGAYKLIPNESVDNDLTTLCEECHGAITISIRSRLSRS